MMLKYFLAWFGMMVLAIVNGGLRDYAYKPLVGNLPAHQISTVILLIVLAGYIRLLVRIWPIRSAGQAWAIGAVWFLMTEGFEIGMRLISGESWSTILQAYNIFKGEVWMFIPIWVLVGPYVFFRGAHKE